MHTRIIMPAHPQYSEPRVPEERLMPLLEDGFVHVVQQRFKDDGRNIGGELWFERAHLPWTIQALQSCLRTYGFPEARLRAGQDDLKIFESGPEQEPVINLFNVRPMHAAHGGVYARSFSRAPAAHLIEQLAKLG